MLEKQNKGMEKFCQYHKNQHHNTEACLMCARNKVTGKVWLNTYFGRAPRSLCHLVVKLSWNNAKKADRSANKTFR